ncbi:P-loop containing nucleoside triphosphate hydrolase protein [Roridomyces roridus]|uniref:P-loop containing nucleoside triphosphate hydrolase protein n=1 Tax=Roridomyces roridus TaxID=1738132 RepID=A0AAD7FR13_9AGAR|nr:P-loop containing nucleoside triphosphate hydrolase protein [Roridomyces roridus]
MRLAACVPPIPEDLLSSLAQVGIQTDSDLLFSGSTSDIFQRLPRGTTTLKELAQITALVAESASAQGHKASDLLRDSEPDRFLSGVPQLDQFLEGLTTPRRMIEVSGDRGSGKTSLLLYLVLRHLVEQPQSSVLWIDTTGDFSVTRAEEILQNFDGPGASTTLDRLQVSLALEVDAVYEVLEDLRLSFNMSRVQGIVVDCVTPLFSSLLSPVSSHGHAIMTLFMRQLRAFATTFSITVFVVNNSTLFTPFVPGSASNNPNIRKPSLGPSFTFLTDATVWLVLDAESDSGNEGTKHIAQLYRSKITAPKSPCWFEMRQGVLRQIEWK